MKRFWPWLFIIVPVTELYVIVAVGEVIGAFWTVLLVIVTAVIGVNLLRWQGLDTLARAQQAVSQGTLPAGEIFEGIVLAVGGGLLLTPGFITDTLGLLCLMPASRRLLVAAIMRRVTLHATGQVKGAFGSGEAGSATRGGADFIDAGEHRRSSRGRSVPSGRVFEGECKREDTPPE